MKVFLKLKEGPISQVLCAIIVAAGSEETDNIEQADRVLVMSPEDALFCLKQTDALVDILLLPEKRAREGANALAKNFPERVEVFELLEENEPDFSKLLAIWSEGGGK